MVSVINFRNNSKGLIRCKLLQTRFFSFKQSIFCSIQSISQKVPPAFCVGQICLGLRNLTLHLFSGMTSISISCESDQQSLCLQLTFGYTSSCRPASVPNLNTYIPTTGRSGGFQTSSHGFRSNLVAMSLRHTNRNRKTR